MTVKFNLLNLYEGSDDILDVMTGFSLGLKFLLFMIRIAVLVRVDFPISEQPSFRKVTSMLEPFFVKFVILEDE